MKTHIKHGSPLAALITSLVLMLALPAVVEAQYTFTANNGTITITKYIGPGGAVSIPGTINGLPVCSVGDWAFQSCQSLTSITLPDSVTNIGSLAFGSCIDLTNVVISDSVISIGDAAFSNCWRLATVTIPNSVTSIGNSAFVACGTLTNVTIGNSVVGIGDFAFSWCSSLEEAYFGGNAPTPGLSVFEGDSLATVYYLPGTTGWGATFGGRPTALWNAGWFGALQVSIGPPGVVSAGAQWQVDGGAWQNSGTTVSNLEVGGHTVTFTTVDGWTTPASQVVLVSSNQTATVTGTYSSVQEVGSLTATLSPAQVVSAGAQWQVDGGAWQNSGTTVSNLAVGGHTVTFTTVSGWTTPASQAVLVSSNQTATVTGTYVGVLAGYSYTNNNGTITITGYTGPGGAVTIPNEINNLPVTGIGGNAFGGCRSLTQVAIGNSVTTIGPLAFQGCLGLTSFSIGSGVTSIGEGAFDSCTSLSAITVDPLNASYSSADAVLFNKSQTTLIVCSPGKTGAYTIPNTVTSIGTNAFSDCSLTSVTIPDSVTRIGDNAFNFCSGLTTLTIPDGVISIGDNAFSDCYGLTSLTLPSSLTSIGDWAFGYCGSLTSVTIPTSVTSIEDSAFYRCFSLTNVTIGNNVTSIGEGAFGACSGLTSVTLGNRVTNIGNYAFSSCTSLTSVTIPNSVTSIGEGAFEWCSGLTSITIPNGVTNIGDSAFESCTGLTSVTIGNSLTNVWNWAFGGCTSLTAIAVDALNPVYVSVAGVLFNKSLTTLIEFPQGKAGPYTIPNSVTSIGDSAFSSCTSLTSVRIPNSVTNIGSLAFDSCVHLTGVYFEGNAPNVPSYGFPVASDVFSGDNKLSAVYYLPGTTGWSYFSAQTGIPALLWTPQVQTSDASFGVRSNQFGFNINWASGMSVVVETSTNLVNPVWTPLATNTLAGGTAYFSDPHWTNYSARFYRLRSP